MTTDVASPLDASLAEFLHGPVSISVAACSPSFDPVLARATGLRISADRRQIAILISAVQARPVLDCVQASGAVAVVFSEPSTHRTVQLKGRDAVVEPIRAGDANLIADYRVAFARELAPLGFSEALVDALLSCPGQELACIRFTPTEAYSQTPGPKAGERLRRAE